MGGKGEKALYQKYIPKMNPRIKGKNQGIYVYVIKYNNFCKYFKF